MIYDAGLPTSLSDFGILRGFRPCMQYQSNQLGGRRNGLLSTGMNWQFSVALFQKVSQEGFLGKIYITTCEG